MEKSLHKILSALRDELVTHILLSKSERLRIFDAISRAAQAQNSGKAFKHLDSIDEPIVSPFVTEADVVRGRSTFTADTKEKNKAKTGMFSFLHGNMFFMNRASLALAIMLVVGGGVSFAAEKSIPGDPLYIVKTNFNENIQSFLTFTPTSRARLEATLAERRLSEAQKLALSPDANIEQKEALVSSFKKHTEAFKVSLQDVQDRSQPVEVAALSADFQSMLAAHGNLIRTTLNASDTSATLLAVSEELSSIEAARIQAEQMILTLSPEQLEAETLDRAVEASNLLESFKAKISGITGDTSDIDMYILDAYDLYEQGEEAFEASLYADAYTKFQLSIVMMREIEATFNKAKQLNLSSEVQANVLKQIFHNNGIAALSTEADALDIATTTATSTDGSIPAVQ